MNENAHGHNHFFEASQKALWIAIVITGIIMVVEFIGGFLANSLALVSDAGHMLTDIMSLFLSLFALRLAVRPSSVTKTYGLYRMEILAALINGTTLILLSLYIIYEAYDRFLALQPVNSRIMIWVALVGLIANGISAWVMMRRSKESLNMRGAYLHILGDALSSVGVIAGGLIITFTGWYLVDPLISAVICVVILRGAFVLVKDAVNILLEAAPKDVSLEDVQKAIHSIPGVEDLHHVHLWTIASGMHALSAHVVVGDVLTSRTGEILSEINKLLLEKYKIPHTTIQFECENCEEGFVCNVDKVCIAVTRGHAAHGHDHDH
ncbi:MAG: cation diffusion facilitator family transporter [Deltaproteobacteria bacterium]|nr:cation diffusion facilitator family transporter [Deltaproteobacteria bacterium]